MSWRKTLIPTGTPIRKAIEVIDEAGVQIALVVDDEGRLLGTITDGDVRRGIIQGCDLADPVDSIMNRGPTTAKASTNDAAVRRIMRERGIRSVPILDDDGRVVGLRRDLDFEDDRVFDNPVVLMAGGLGLRLRPLTIDVPKPLLRIGSKPILELILERFVESGFRNFYISVNFKAEMIEDHFGRGDQWGVNIDYLREDDSLGTAGSLGLLPRDIECPAVIMNGDVLTKVSFAKLLEFHERERAEATMCVREYDLQVPYGVVRLDGHDILEVREKPIQRFFVNSGIYVLNPDVIRSIDPGRRLDMPNLFEQLMDKGHRTSAFPLREYWLDIGQLDDFRRAEGEVEKIFGAAAGLLEEPEKRSG